MNEQAGGQLLPAPLVDVRAPAPQDNRDSWHISFLDKKHPALGHLVEPASLYESVLVYKHVRMDGRRGARPGCWPGSTTASRSWSQRNVEKGKVLMLGTSAHVNWSNLPLRPIFLPLVARLTFELAGVEQTSHNVDGRPAAGARSCPTEPRPVGVEVRPARRRDLAAEAPQARTGPEPARPSATPTRTRSASTCCGCWTRPVHARSPTRSTSIPTRPIRRRSTARSCRSVSAARRWCSPTIPTTSPARSPCSARARACGALFLAAVLIGLVFETFVSNRLSPKQEEQTGSAAPAGHAAIGEEGDVGMTEKHVAQPPSAGAAAVPAPSRRGRRARKSSSPAALGWEHACQACQDRIPSQSAPHPSGDRALFVTFCTSQRWIFVRVCPHARLGPLPARPRPNAVDARGHRHAGSRASGVYTVA